MSKLLPFVISYCFDISEGEERCVQYTIALYRPCAWYFAGREEFCSTNGAVFTIMEGTLSG